MGTRSDAGNILKEEEEEEDRGRLGRKGVAIRVRARRGRAARW